jgi:hypothetical protein
MSEETQSQEVPTSVECPAAKDPAVRLFIVSAMLIGGGIWCFLDGYIKHKPAKVETVNEIATYYTNHVGGILLPLLGLIMLIWGIVFLRRRLVADQDGIGYVGKEKIPWTAVRSLDTGKLASKGILRLRYDSEGTEAVLVLDGWKLQGFRELVMLVEKKVKPAEGQ